MVQHLTVQSYLAYSRARMIMAHNNAQQVSKSRKAEWPALTVVAAQWIPFLRSARGVQRASTHVANGLGSFPAHRSASGRDAFGKVYDRERLRRAQQRVRQRPDERNWYRSRRRKNHTYPAACSRTACSGPAGFEGEEEDNKEKYVGYMRSKIRPDATFKWSSQEILAINN